MKILISSLLTVLCGASCLAAITSKDMQGFTIGSSFMSISAGLFLLINKNRKRTE